MCYLFVGICGVGSVLVWVLCWNCILDYFYQVNDVMCVLVQIEMCEVMSNLVLIFDVDGIDGVFIGLVDFSVDMGFVGNLQYLEVQVVIENVIVQICVVGKVLGILMVNELLVKCYLELGVLFVVVGVDIMLLVCGVEVLVVCFGVEKNLFGVFGVY